MTVRDIVVLDLRFVTLLVVVMAISHSVVQLTSGKPIGLWAFMVHMLPYQLVVGPVVIHLGSWLAWKSQKRRASEAASSQGSQPLSPP
jgi:hypothetical protein